MYKSIGIICEFNPLHSGHAMLLEKARSLAECVVCIMSGEVVQRGEIAMFDKWQRTRAALQCGADLVIELPSAYVLSSANTFAYGGVSILDALCVDAIIFGSECGNIDELWECAHALTTEDDTFKQRISDELDKGTPYPKALSLALGNDLIQSPNNILGIEYLKAIIGLNSKIKAHTITRCGAPHDSDIPTDTASGSYLRAQIANGNIDSATGFMPYKMSSPRFTHSIEAFIVGYIRANESSAFHGIADVNEGIENRVIEASFNATTLDELIDGVKTKRYTRARICRLLLNTVLGMPQGLAFTKPTYARVLGLNNTGRVYLKSIKKTTTLDIVTKVADYNGNDAKFNYDLKATDLACLCEGVNAKRDFTTSPQIL